MNKLFLYSIAAMLLCIFISGCSYYRYTANKKPAKYTPSKPGTWKELDSANILVIHYKNEVKEVYNIAYDDQSKTIKGDLRPFEGRGLYYYNKVMKKGGGVAKSKRRSSEFSTTRQVHFFINQPTVSDSSKMQFAVTDISRIDVSKHATGLNILVPLGVGLASVAVGTGVFLLIVCNCPHVYVNDGAELKLTNSIYTGAKAPQLERFDHKLMPDYFADSTGYTLNIVNELNEDQYTNMVELVVAVHEKDVEVLADKDGQIHSISRPQLPVEAKDNAGKNIIRELSAPDGISYSFNADSASDLINAYLQFAIPEQTTGYGKLVLRLRNTPWSGFVYHQFSSLFGKNYARWVRKNKNTSKEEREKWIREQGIKLQIEMKTANGWHKAGEVDLVGEINFNSIVIPLQVAAGTKKLELRLRSGFMFWELDYAAVDFAPETKTNILVLKPQAAKGEAGQDYLQALRYDDDEYMQHVGERASTKVSFTTLPVNAALKRTIILRSKGYYTSREQFAGKTYRKELKKFKVPGQLSRFSRKLYEDAMLRLVMN